MHTFGSDVRTKRRGFAGRLRRSAARWAAALGTATLAVGGLVVLTSATTADALAPNVSPQFLRSIGGQGRPGVFAWGIQHNPVTDEILVSDYLNFKVRRYDTLGNPIGDFFRQDRAGQPYTIAVDPVDGDIYVAELKDNPLTASIAKYDKFGNYLYDADASLVSNTGNRFRAFYPVWMTVEEDTGNLIVLDSHYQNLKPGVSLSEANPPRVLTLRFNDDTQTVDEVDAFEVSPPDAQGADKPRLYGIDIDDQDRIYMSDAWNTRGYIYSKQGELLHVFGETQTGGDNRGVVVNDALDRIYLVDAIHSDIDVFDSTDGSYIRSFSREGNGPGQFTGGGRQIDVDSDGNVWVADFGGFEAEKFTADGVPLLRAPDPARRPPVGLLAQPRDVAVDQQTGEVWVADSWAQRIQRFSPNGTAMGAWGERGAGGDFDMNYPRHIAVQPATASTPKRLWVVNERGHHIKIYNYPTSATASPVFVRQLGDALVDATTNGAFRWPGDVEFHTRPDGRQIAVVTDRMASSVKVLDAVTFQELDMTPADGGDPDKNFIPVLSSGTAIDPATGTMYLGNGTRVLVYDQTGTRLREFGSAGTGPGQFRDIADLVHCNGQIYVSDEASSKVSVFEKDGTYVTRWGATYGSTSADFKGAIGLACDAQNRIYVTDSGNDRIQVFSTVATRPNDPTAPSAPVVTSPAQGATLPLGAVTFTGTASDNVSVGQVELTVQDADTGLYWDSAQAAWEAGETNSLASWTSNAAPAANVSWRWTFSGVAKQGRYIVEVKTRDHNGTVGPSVMRTFAMTGATAPPVPLPPARDTVRPDGTLAFPSRTPTADLPLGPVQFSGNATDDTGVASVRIAVKRNADGRWWNGGTSSGGFTTAYTTWVANLTVPDGTSTGWTWDWTPRAAGAYTVIVEARDAAGNADSSKPSVVFNVTTDAPDTTAADTAITSPQDGASLPSGTLSITGTATDDRQVGSVRLQVRDAEGGYWNGSAFVATPTTVVAAVSGAGTPSATWSYSLNGVPAGGYAISATATDGSNNPDPSPATSSVTLSGAPDTAPPVLAVTAPANNGTVSGTEVTISGTATDDTGVGAVRVAIQNTTTKQWWTGSGWGAFTNLSAVVSEPGAGSTTWRYAFSPPSGKLGYQAFGTDVVGNQSGKTPWRTVTLQ